LHRDNIDARNHRIVYNRKQLGNGLGQNGVAIAIGRSLERLLAKLPKEGWLFPHLAQQNEKIRASRFRKCCDRLGFTYISLHSYRYAWAQRAKTAGMPLREAMTHLGHSSRTIHQAYSEKAEAVTFPLEYYEEVRRKKEKEMRAQMQIAKV
jgi:integrase